MFNLKIYVPGLTRNNPDDTNWNVQLRIFNADAIISTDMLGSERGPTVNSDIRTSFSEPNKNTGMLGEITLRIPDTDIQEWKDILGKFSKPIEIVF